MSLLQRVLSSQTLSIFPVEILSFSHSKFIIFSVSALMFYIGQTSRTAVLPSWQLLVTAILPCRSAQLQYCQDAVWTSICTVTTAIFKQQTWITAKFNIIISITWHHLYENCFWELEITLNTKPLSIIN